MRRRGWQQERRVHTRAGHTLADVRPQRPDAAVAVLATVVAVQRSAAIAEASHTASHTRRGRTGRG